VWTVEEEKRVMEEQIRIHRNIRLRGFSFFWSTVVLLVLGGSWCGWVWLAISSHERISALESELAKYRTETVIEHHVAVIGRLEDGDFAFQSDEEPRGGVYRPCPTDIANGLDVNRMLSEATGYVAEYAAWEERGACKSILRADLGFWWRNKDTGFKFATAATTKGY
jgi:hypothetical protein